MLFQYEDRAKQLIDYTNLSWKFIHPSDIDGVLEFDNKKLILLEYKTAGKSVDKGQVLLLQRLVDNWQGKAIAIVADHYTQANEIVDGGNAIVRCVYYNKQWHMAYLKEKRTVKSVVENFAKDEIKKKIQQP